MSKGRATTPNYLLDVNVLVALLSEEHVHHSLVQAWFDTPEMEWSLCPFTEAGFLRNATSRRPGQITMSEATELLKELAKHPGYHHLPIQDDWQTLCGSFFPRLYGTKQVTDAYLLGLAVRGGLVLATMDRAILHLAGLEYEKYVSVLKVKEGGGKR